MKRVAAAILAASVHGAMHVNKSLESASMWGDVGLGADGHMYVKGEYIVVFKRGLADAKRKDHLSFIPEASVMRKYEGSLFHGYAAKLSDEERRKVEQSPEVAYVEPNGIVWATSEQEGTCDFTMPMEDGVWGTIRTNNRENIIPVVDPPWSYYEGAGEGIDVHSYVIDTGIDTAHPAFGGRALFGADFTGEGPGDGNGHGTHVAGTMIGLGYGICQHGQTSAVKVLNAQGSGTYANVIAGIQWTATDSQNPPRTGKGVANLSLGGGFSQAVSDAIEDVFSRGIICVVAAGNGNAAGNGVDACTVSPAAAAHSISVGATTTLDAKTQWSNWGCCVDVYAPGANILSTLPNGGFASYSGTSMAAPHIAGITQAYWGINPDEPTSRIKEDIIAQATTEADGAGITSPQAGTSLSGSCTSANANCRRSGGACDPAGNTPATWNNQKLGYQRCSRV